MVTTGDSVFVFSNLPSMNDSFKRLLALSPVIPRRRHSSHDISSSVPSIEVSPPSPGTPDHKMSFLKEEIDKFMTALEVCRNNLRRSSEPCLGSNLDVPIEISRRRRMSMPSISYQHLLKVPTPTKKKRRRRHSLPAEITKHPSSVSFITPSQLKCTKSKNISSFEKIRHVENNFGEKTTVHEIFIDGFTHFNNDQMEKDDKNDDEVYDTNTCNAHTCGGMLSSHLNGGTSDCKSNENVSTLPTLTLVLTTPLEGNNTTISSIQDATQPTFDIIPMTTTCVRTGEELVSEEVSNFSAKHLSFLSNARTAELTTLIHTKQRLKSTNKITHRSACKCYEKTLTDIFNKQCVIQKLPPAHSTTNQLGVIVAKADIFRDITPEISDRLCGSTTMRTISSDEAMTSNDSSDHKVDDQITSDDFNGFETHILQQHNNNGVNSNREIVSSDALNPEEGEMSPTRTLSGVLNIIPDVISAKPNAEFLFTFNDSTTNTRSRDIVPSKVAYNVKTNDINMITTTSCNSEMFPTKTTASDKSSDDDVNDSKTKASKKDSFESIAEVNEDDIQPSTSLPKANSLTRLDSFDKVNNHKSPSKHRAVSFHEASIGDADLLNKLTTSYDTQPTSASMEQLDGPDDMQQTPVNKFNRKFANAVMRKAVSLYELQNERFKENVAKFEQKFLSTEVLSVRDGEDDSEQFFPRISIEDCSSCASCRSRSSSYHSLLYDIDTANKYPIYQPTVCDYVDDNQSNDSQANEIMVDTNGGDNGESKEVNMSNTKLTNDVMRTKKEKLMKQGQAALGNFKEKWRRVKSKV